VLVGKIAACRTLLFSIRAVATDELPVELVMFFVVLLQATKYPMAKTSV
jgi:hypothetical protein